MAFQTDASRAKTIEIQIQARVAQELDRIRSREQQTLKDVEKRLAENKDHNSLAPTVVAPTTTASSPFQGSLDLDAPRIPFAGREWEYPAATPPPAVSETAYPRGLTHDSVAEGINELRSKLDGRRKLMDLDQGLERAREDVAGCLRLNDRRPLDCWKEVESFKKEVARLEEAFVDRIVG